MIVRGWVSESEGTWYVDGGDDAGRCEGVVAMTFEGEADGMRHAWEEYNECEDVHACVASDGKETQ